MMKEEESESRRERHGGGRLFQFAVIAHPGACSTQGYLDFFSLDAVARGSTSAALSLSLLTSSSDFVAAVWEDAACLACRHGPLVTLWDYSLPGHHLGSGDCCDLPRRFQERWVTPARIWPLPLSSDWFSALIPDMFRCWQVVAKMKQKNHW